MAYRHCQLRHHQRVWEETPKKICGMLSHVFSNITPPFPDERLKNQFTTLEIETDNKIREIVRQHLTASIEENKTGLGRLNPDNKEEALNIVYKQLTRNLGRKMDHEEKKRLLAEASDLLTYYITDDRDQAHDQETRKDRAETDNAAGDGTSTKDGPVTEKDKTKEGHAQPDSDKQTMTDVEQSGPSSPEQMEAQNSTRKRGRSDLATPTGRSPTQLILEEDSPTLPITQEQKTKKNKTNEGSPTTASKFIHSSRMRTEEGRGESQAITHRAEGKRDWRCQPKETTHTVIFGDSNMNLARKIPPGTEVHSFPGLRFGHAADILNKLHRPDNPLRVVIAAGVNHRDDLTSSVDGELDQLQRAVADSDHEVIMAGVPVSHTHNPNQKRLINSINARLRETYQGRFAEAIKPEHVIIEAKDAYKIHHTQTTTDKVIDSILTFLD